MELTTVIAKIAKVRCVQGTPVLDGVLVVCVVLGGYFTWFGWFAVPPASHG